MAGFLSLAVAATLLLVSAVSLLSPSTVFRLCYQALAHFNQVLVLCANQLRLVVVSSPNSRTPIEHDPKEGVY